jgi:outer membrane protein assembly factor BamB
MSKKIVSIIIVFALVAILFNIRIFTLRDTTELQLSHASSLINLDISWPPQRPTIPIKLKWVFTTGHYVVSSPVLGDIDGDGKLEVVIGSYDKKIYAINGEDCSQLWNYTTSDWVESSPALGDINSDGKLEVIVCSLGTYTEIGEQVTLDRICALSGATGLEIWNHTIGRVWGSSPRLGDIDNDGGLEVVVACSATFNPYTGENIAPPMIYALNGEDGSVVWTHILPESIESTPAVGDLDNDGRLEVVVGCKDHKIYVLNGENGTQQWNFTTGGPILSSPALGDIDGDGKLEIVIGSDDKRIYALNGDGSQLWNFTTGDWVESSPALGDVNSDGKLEVIVGSEDHKIYALNGENGTQLWNFITGGAVFSSPALADVDGDDKLEVVVGSNDKKIYALNGEDGSELWSYRTGGFVWSSPAVGDIDNDGGLEIVVGSGDHNVYAFDTTSSTYNEDNEFLLIGIGVIVALLVTCTFVIRFYFFKKRDLEKERKR